MVNMGIRLRRKGFDASRYDRSTKKYTVGCSRCQAAVINGVPAHEHGCPNIPKENHNDD